MSDSRLSILEGDDADDPILSVVNIIDVFLVIIAVLLIAVIENPINPWSAANAVIVTDPGTAQMQITIKKGREMKQYKSAGEIGEGEGTKAGTAYMLKDGTMVYVPEDEAK